MLHGTEAELHNMRDRGKQAGFLGHHVREKREKQNKRRGKIDGPG